jgi:tRNA (cmo5U34)-methyltransferase|tara:strand:+ start:3467 stop:4168 length:702 start_codon:yes stop_codon:yes gene_type:complete
MYWINIMTDFTFAHRQEGFDDHIDMSIRGYSDLLDDVVSLSRYFVEANTNVVDIGCSTGKLTARILSHNEEVCPDANYVGVEVAEGFFGDLEERAKKLSSSNVTFIQDDIRNYTFENCSLVTSLFTLQFMPYSCRKNILQDIYNGLNEGGAFIFGEKIDTTHSRIENMIRTIYYEYKRTSFDYEDIMTKELTLKNMLKPNSWNEIEDMLNDVGFKAVQTFWQNHMFIGAIAIK